MELTPHMVPFHGEPQAYLSHFWSLPATGRVRGDSCQAGKLHQERLPLPWPGARDGVSNNDVTPRLCPCSVPPRGALSATPRHHWHPDAHLHGLPNIPRRGKGLSACGRRLRGSAPPLPVLPFEDLASSPARWITGEMTRVPGLGHEHSRTHPIAWPRSWGGGQRRSLGLKPSTLAALLQAQLSGPPLPSPASPPRHPETLGVLVFGPLSSTGSGPQEGPWSPHHC